MKTKLLYLTILLLFVGCRGVEPVVSEVHDTIVETRHDSIFRVIHEEIFNNFHDSVSHVEYVRGDTVFVNDYKVVVRERSEKLSDSTIRAIVDSLRASIVMKEPEYIEKPLSTKEKILLKLGYAFFFLLALMVSYILLRIAVKRNWLSSLRKLLSL